MTRDEIVGILGWAAPDLQLGDVAVAVDDEMARIAIAFRRPPEEVGRIRAAMLDYLPLGIDVEFMSTMRIP